MQQTQQLTQDVSTAAIELPEFRGLGEHRKVFFMYDWITLSESSWLVVVRNLFIKLNTKISSVNAYNGQNSVNGHFDSECEEKIDTICNSSFPFMATFYSSNRLGQKVLEVSVFNNANGTGLCVDLIDKSMAPVIFEESVINTLAGHVIQFYGSSTLFRRVAKGASYLNNMPDEGVTSNTKLNDQYGYRLVAWRNAICQARFAIRQNGMFRELYNANYLTQSHLQRVYDNTTVESLFREYGTITSLANYNGMYQVEFKDKNLKILRQLLENSGLISAANNQLS